MFEISQNILGQSVAIGTCFHLHKQESGFPAGISVAELAARKPARSDSPQNERARQCEEAVIAIIYETHWKLELVLYSAEQHNRTCLLCISSDIDLPAPMERVFFTCSHEPAISAALMTRHFLSPARWRGRQGTSAQALSRPRMAVSSLRIATRSMGAVAALASALMRLSSLLRAPLMVKPCSYSSSRMRRMSSTS